MKRRYQLPFQTVVHSRKNQIQINQLSSFAPTQIKHLKRTHAVLLRSGQFFDTLTAGKLAADIATSHPSHLRYADAVFGLIDPPLNAFIYNSMIRGHAQSLRPYKSFAFYRSMIADGCAPNNYTFNFLLKAAARLDDRRIGLAVHGIVARRGLDDFDPFIQTSLISFYCLIGYVDCARQVFDDISSRDVACWNAMIKGFVDSDRHAEAIYLFRVLQEGDGCGHGGDEITMLSVVSACTHLGALDMGKWMHAYIDKRRMRVSLNLGTALVNMYARCGEIGTSISLFRKVHKKDVRLWSVMISGFAFHGLAKEAMALFEEMKLDGFSPDSVTLTGVLNACSHAGLVENGLQILDQMKIMYNVEPTIEHYGCVVDLLGRAGKLKEALNLIKRIPIKPDVVIWGALLVSCRIHKNLEIGKLVAKEMLDLDPWNAGALVFLSNVYAATGEWDLVQQVRSSMKEQRIYKPPGSSLVELGGTVHEFLSGGHKHPQSNEIYKMITEIGRILSLKGHKPTTKGITFDIDDEDKEVCISQHSEKLAVAFGLINTRKGDVIRIVKNLRICEDCHMVMKLVSEVYDRVVIIRDRNRFHHFKGGSCSCGDYW